jgi:hypothetical protein
MQEGGKFHLLSVALILLLPSLLIAKSLFCRLLSRTPAMEIGTPVNAKIPLQMEGKARNSRRKRLRAMDFFRFHALLAGNLIAGPLQQD